MIPGCAPNIFQEFDHWLSSAKESWWKAWTFLASEHSRNSCQGRNIVFDWVPGQQETIFQSKIHDLWRCLTLNLMSSCQWSNNIYVKSTVYRGSGHVTRDDGVDVWQLILTSWQDHDNICQQEKLIFHCHNWLALLSRCNISWACSVATMIPIILTLLLSLMLREM